MRAGELTGKAPWTGQWRERKEGGCPAGFPEGLRVLWQVDQDQGTQEKGVESQATLHTEGPERRADLPWAECEMARDLPLGRRTGGPASGPSPLGAGWGLESWP